VVPVSPDSPDAIPLLLDVSALRRPGSDRGIGRFVRQVRSSAERMGSVRVTEYEGTSGPGGSRWSEWTELPARVRAVHRHGGLYHATTPYHLAPPYGARSIVSVLDIIPLDVPGYLQTGAKSRAFFSLVRRCKGVVVLSEHSAQRVQAALGVAPERVEVCPLPVGLDAASAAPACACALDDLPAVFVSTIADVVAVDPRKRLAWLFTLAARLRESAIGLVIAGTGTERLALSNVTGLGRLCDRHLAEMLQRSLCFVYASAYEGQGLPPQEALSLGVPVVALRNTSLPEMLGPGALWVEEPPDPSLDDAALRADVFGRVDAMAEQVLRLAGDAQLRAATGAAGMTHVGAFTVQRFDATLEGIYRRAADA
jgi:glycosyltransferase involved in cell wall biosynthesis